MVKYNRELMIHIHPPMNKRYSAFTPNTFGLVNQFTIHPSRVYSIRNVNIIQASDMLVIAPDGDTLQTSKLEGPWKALETIQASNKCHYFVTPSGYLELP